MVTQSAQQLDVAVMERILDVVRRLGAPIDLDTMLAEVVDAALAVMRAERGTVFLYDADTDELFSKVATGTGQIRFPATRGIAGECAHGRAVINVPDCYADPRFNPEIDRKTGYRTRCLLTVPLIGNDEKLVGVMQLLNKQGGVFEEQDERIATALAAQCAVALQRAQLIQAQIKKQKLERDLALARDIQQGVLPEVMPVLPGYDLAGYSQPAEETGGDIYDAAPLPGGRAMILMGDATGHGIGPALSVTQMRAMVRMAIRLGAHLDLIFTHVNDQLADDLASNRFVTAFVGVLDSTNHRVEYHSGGQGPLLHFHAATGEFDVLDASTIPMGIMSDLPLSAPSPIELLPGDIFALISDGVFEYLNSVGKQFSHESVQDVIRENCKLPAPMIIEAINTAVAAFAAGSPQCDDITIVLVKRLG